MSDLHTLQRQFLGFLLHGDPAITDAIVDQAPVGREIRLGIYANAYRLRLRETLETDHEMLGLYLGDTLWDQLTDGYIADQPSTFRSLRQYGDALPEWLRRHPPFAEYPQIAEMADFERRLLTAFDAADTARCALSDLADIPAQRWPMLRLRFHPSVQPFAATTNCIPIWQALKAGHTPPDPSQQQPATWLLWRGTDRLTEFRTLPDHEDALLQHFLAGGDFADGCALLLPLLGEQEVASGALELLSAWLQHGLIRELLTADAPPPRAA